MKCAVVTVWLAGVALLNAIGAATAQSPEGVAFRVPLIVSHSSADVISGSPAEGLRTKYIGTAAGAVDGLGLEDRTYFALSESSVADLFIFHEAGEPGWTDRRVRLRTDIRAPLTAGASKTWNALVAFTDTPGTVTVSWGSLADVPSSVELLLLDPNDINADGVTSYEMREVPSISFEETASGADTTSRVFQIRATLLPETPGGLAFSTDPRVLEITSTGATVSVGLTQDASVVLEYGTNPDALDQRLEGTQPGRSFSLPLSGLQPNTAYTVRVTATAPGQPAVTRTLSFTTVAQTQFSVQPTVSDLTGTAATLHFGTSVPSTARVDYGPTADYGLVREVTTAAAEHTITLTDLTPGTTYHFRVTATSPTGGPVASQDLQFTTPSGVVLRNPQVIGLTRTGGIVTFTTDVPATATVEYGLTDALGSQVVSDTAATEHRLVLTGLQPGTEYRFRVRVQAPGRAESVSDILTFRTLVRVPGDVGDVPDERVDREDVVRVLFYAVGAAEPTGEQFLAADINQDGRIDIADVVRALRIHLGLDSSTP